MTCATNHGFYEWNEQIPISFSQWKTILSKFSNNERSKLSCSSNHHPRSTSQLKKPDRSLLGRNPLFGSGVVNSILVSSSLSLSRQDVPKTLAPSSKRFASSFKTLVNTTNNKQTQRINYINDSVMIFKLSKEHASDSSTLANSQLSSKHSTLSLGTSSTTTSSKILQQQQQPPSPSRLSPLLKIEGQKHRIVHHDSPIIVPSTIDITLPSSLTSPMTTSTTSQLQTNSSVFTYRSAAAGGNTVRQRAIAETTSSSLLISAERFKSNVPTTLRQTRQPVTTTTTALSSTYISSQPAPRNTKSRVQQEKIPSSRDIYEYPDPFTNCPQDVLNKLAQLTKLQLETIDWEKKKRFTKKKTIYKWNYTRKRQSIINKMCKKISLISSRLNLSRLCVCFETKLWSFFFLPIKTMMTICV